MSNSENIVPVSFSLYCDEDYDGFLACINDFYDGGYPYPEYLVRERLHRLTDGGDMLITLAKDHGGRIVGTSAALRMDGRFSGSVLLLLRCVRKAMRGHGIGSLQELFLLEQIRIRFPDASSLYADVMTHDAVSQTTMLHRGFVFCGLRMALYKNEIIVPHLKYASGTKMSQAIYCKSTACDGSRTLFAPEELRADISDIYRALGVTASFRAGKAGGECLYELEVNGVHQSAEIFVDRHGDTQGLSASVKALIGSGNTAVAYLNMSLAGCTATYEALIALGFYFSGVKPLSDTGEYLVMSHTAHCALSLDDIKLPTEAVPLYRTIAKEIKNET